MEFRHSAVTVFFQLVIGRAHAGVEIIDVMVDNGDLSDEQFTTKRLSQAILQARLR
jgi:hypothetical protein